MDKPKDTVFIPCGHVCSCEECGEKIIEDSKICPICKSVISSKHKVYIT